MNVGNLEMWVNNRGSTMNEMMLLIEPLIPSLRRYASALLRDRTAADDLVQDCLERAITYWDRRRPDGNVRAWLFTILHNLAVTRAHQNARRGQQVSIEDVDEGVFARPAAQEDGLRQQDLLRALDQLPAEQRSVLLLISVEGFSYAEVAQALDIPIGTVMSRLMRAREKLLKAMEKDAESYRPLLRRIK
jgi:RNA polymerase sigma-70 factor (ECF subfamily)